MAEGMFAGVDVETIGTDPRKHRVVQVGVALPHPSGGRPRTFSSAVGWDADDLSLDRDAMEVHRITLDRILRAPRSHEVDAALCRFLAEQNARPGSIIPVGWNAGSFDMPFVRAAFPHAARYFHPYRAVDLNSVVYAAAGLDGYPQLKTRLKRQASIRLGEQMEHDAGFDAASSIIIFELLRARFPAAGMHAALEYAVRCSMCREWIPIAPHEWDPVKTLASHACGKDGRERLPRAEEGIHE